MVASGGAAVYRSIRGGTSHRGVVSVDSRRLWSFVPGKDRPGHVGAPAGPNHPKEAHTTNIAAAYFYSCASWQQCIAGRQQ